MLKRLLCVSGFKKFQPCLLSMLVLNALNVHAQQSSPPQEVTADKEEIERITISGGNLDAANRAFYAGDFVLAEIEFKQNAKCALRMERNKQAFVSGLQNSAINSALQSTASIQSGTSAQGNAVANASGPTSNISGKLANRAESTTVPEHTCDDRGYQLYMLGLSQIQLGRPDEAEKNLKTATFLNRNIYDAHYRLALMQLLRNDKKSAEERLANIQEIQEKCGDCKGSDEITARISFLEKALSGEIKLN